MKVTKRPIQVEAVRINHNQDDIDEILSWSIKERPIVVISDENDGNKKVRHIEITTLEGVMKGDVGDWIIKGVNGEVYPCKDDIFLKTYDIILNPR